MAITLLFGTETGNAEECAEELNDAIDELGIPCRVVDMEDYAHDQLNQEQMLVVITSTYGNGDPPANAEDLLEHLQEQRPPLPGTPFAVCGLGDRTYARFCQCGKDFDALLEELGGQRQIDRVDCDADYEMFFSEFKENLLNHLRTNKARYDGPVGTAPAKRAHAEHFSAKRPFLGTLTAKRQLNPGSTTGDTWHYEVDLGGSNLDWAPGDSFGVIPTNDPAEVAEVLKAAGLNGTETVVLKDQSFTLEHALTHRLCLQRISADLLRRFAALQGPAMEAVSAGTEAEYTANRHVLDGLTDHPLLGIGPQNLVKVLRSLAPRLYSVASAQEHDASGVAFCVATTRFALGERAVKGVASCWLEERVQVGDKVPLYRVENRSFRNPAPEVPAILIGPGTGIAPFRGFLQQRKTAGGKSWLFFGHRNQAVDYLYKEELEAWLTDGTLDKLSLAWSRDQGAKVYVQDRIREHGAELWQWLAQGGQVFVCGDAKGMAPGVHAALVQIVQEHGGQSDGQAYWDQAEESGRYHKDVY